MFYGPGLAGTFATNVKLAGLNIRQVDNPNSALLTVADFSSSLTAYSLSNVYGSQGNSIASNLFIWA